jgi:glycosyltransferase involved in cell wall biosynthesis
MVREQVLQGLDVHVAVPGEGPVTSQFRESGAVVHLVEVGLPATRPWRIGSLAAGLRGVVAQVMPDLVHSHFVTTTLLARVALRSQRIPRVFQVPGPLHLENVVTRTAEIASANGDDYWIASCEWTRQRYLRSGVSSRRVFHSPYGTDVGRFDRCDRDEARRRLELEPERPAVGLVAYFYRPKRLLGQRIGLKGHEVLIEAMTLVRVRVPDALLVLVGSAWNGSGEYEQRVRALALARLGDGVRFAGHRDDVPEIYPAFDVAAHPSISENLGGAVESLLAGVPTVASSVGGLPDIVRDGDTGWLVPPRDPAALAAAILSALADPPRARRMAARGRALARRQLDVRRTARDVVRIYGEILAMGA